MTEGPAVLFRVEGLGFMVYQISARQEGSAMAKGSVITQTSDNLRTQTSDNLHNL